MLKWKILAAMGFAFGVAGMMWGYAQEKKAPGFYELRVYTAQPGKRDELAQAFAAKTAGIFGKHGITNVGYWIPKQSDPELGISAENTFIDVRGYPSKEERDKRTMAVRDDPEFKEFVTKREADLPPNWLSKCTTLTWNRTALTRLLSSRNSAAAIMLLRRTTSRAFVCEIRSGDREPSSVLYAPLRVRRRCR